MEEWMNVVSYLAVNLFHIYVFYRVYKVFFAGTKVLAWVEPVAFGLLYIINSLTFLIAKNIFLNLLSSVIPLILITIIYKSPKRIKLFVSIFTYVVSMLLDSIIYNVITYMNMDINLSDGVVVNTLSSLLYFLLILGLDAVKKQKSNTRISLSHWLAIFCIPTGSMVIVVSAAHGRYSAGSNITIVIVLLLINILIFELYNMIENYYQKTYEGHLLKQQNEAYLNQFKLIKESEQERRNVRHDLKNHLIALNEYVLQRRWEDVEKYVQKVGAKLQKDEAYVNSGNIAVDSILNYKFKILKDMEVQMTYEVIIPMEIDIDPFDISLILGNLLDNAIEALEKSKAKTLDILLRLDKGVLLIKIKNAYNGFAYKTLSSGKIKYLTSKENKSIHGIGLQNVEKVVDKYNGTIDINSDNQEFFIKIMMYVG